MTFKLQNLSVLSYANNFTIWHYLTEDELQDVKKSGYFNNAGTMLRKNDLIILNTKDHNTSVWVVSDDTNANDTNVNVTEETKVSL